MEFRDLFFSCLDASYPAPALEELRAAGRHHLLAYLPTDALRKAPAAATADEFLAALDRRDREVRPLDLYRHGAAATVEEVPRREIDAALAARPLTLVVFPGIFGELIDQRPFEEVFAADSSDRRRWQEAIDDYRASHPSAEAAATLTDGRFSLDRLTLDDGAVADRPLGELVEVASLDDEDGKPLLRAVLLRPEALSLETLSPVEDLAEIAVRRLGKFFRVMGAGDPAAAENLVLVGYSMGSIVALETLAQAHAKGEEWAGRVRALVSVAGVLHGSHVADQAIDPAPGEEDNPLHRQVTLIRRLMAELEETHRLPWAKKPARVWANTRAWLRFGRAFAEVLEDMVGGGLDLPLPRLLRLGRKVDLSPTLGLVGRFVSTFDLLDPRDYSLNIKKLELLLQAVLTTVEGLTTRARKRWWSRHTLPPSGVRYYALAATMAAAGTSIPDDPDTDLGTNPTAYNPYSLDHQLLAQGYRDFVAGSGIVLNDSQVAVGRACFWPRLAELLRPEAPPATAETEFLGVVGSHHWGVTLPRVNALRDGSINPFPRTALLKAIAARVAMDLDAA